MDLYRNFTQDSRKEEHKTAMNNSRTRAEKVKEHAEYTENKQVKKNIKADRQKYSHSPTSEQISMTIKQINSGKTATSDKIPTATLMSPIEVTTNILQTYSNHEDLGGATSATDRLQRKTPHQHSKV
ncbi:unnamed protein product [Schistosoma mattheei]|uniref:Uncharacterized protein n=1 Tax=Schistosoma mattheei TaxID=31246 RepID=A0A183P2J3_9TREM|nr:unnamed protein product [Schistosoma mattheei]